jgi:hypothetical protein
LSALPSIGEGATEYITWLEFSAPMPWLGGAESDQGIEIFGRSEGVHSEAGC